MKVTGRSNISLPHGPLLLKFELVALLGKNPPLSNDDNVLTREFLLEFSDKTLLHLLELFQEGHWHKQSNALQTKQKLVSDN